MVDKVDRSKFAKGWFLTYPKCPIGKEMLLSELQNKFDVKEYVVCEEEHKDGDKHLHAFVKFGKRIYFKSDRFDVCGYHGNYQIARSWKAVENYVKKGGNYISNLNLDAASKHHSKKLMPEDFERDPLELMEEGKLAPLSLNNFIKNRATYLGLKRGKDYNGEKKCYWVVGKPGIGKSFSIRGVFKDIYIKPQNKWWDGYKGEENVLLDDLDTATLGHYLKIWADQYKFTAESKGASLVPTYKRLFVTSNYSIGELFHEEKLRDAIDRRFITVNADEYIGENGFFEWDNYIDN